MTARGAVIGAAFAATLAAGCAMVPAPPPAPPVRAPAGTIAPALPSATAVDSGPSEAARAVLAAIPEPLPPAERVAAPPVTRLDVGSPTGGSGAGAPADGTAPAADSAAAHSDSADARPDSGRAEVPVPAPTPPLGDRPGSTTPAIPDSLLRPRPAPVDSAAAARPDTCWRLQIVAPKEKARAESFRAAAASQLVVPFVVERENELWKVRTRDCMRRATADALKARALQSGFKGAFLFVGKKP